MNQQMSEEGDYEPAQEGDDLELEYYVQFPTPGALSTETGESDQAPERIWPEGNAKPSVREKDILVILLGWAGAEHKHLIKYSDYYLNRGCIVLRYITPLRYHFLETRSLPKVASKLMKVLKDLQLDSHPTYFHVFSNGGSFTYSYMVKELTRMKFQMDVRGTVFDSAPSPRSLQKVYKALTNIFANLNIFRHVIASIMVFLLVCQVFWFYLKNAVTLCIQGDSLDAIEGVGKESAPLTNWLERIVKTKNHSFLFLYSEEDELIPFEKIERIASILASRGNRVEKVKFDGSEHVLHFKKYPEEYGNALTNFLRSTMKDQGSKTIWGDY